MKWECTVCDVAVDSSTCPAGDCPNGHRAAWRVPSTAQKSETHDRLAYIALPPFDCIRDHANCPGCKRHGENNHGVSGGRAWFAVQRTGVDGLRVALTLEVLRADYSDEHVASMSAETRALLDVGRARGAVLCVHHELSCAMTGSASSEEGGCAWMPGSKGCRVEVGSYLLADEIWRAYGDAIGGPAQSEVFWRRLETQLDTWAPHVTEGN